MSKKKWSKEERKIIKTISPFGLRVVVGKKHRKIIDKNGNCVLGFACTVSDRHWYKNVINELIKRGLIDVPKW